MKKSLLLIIIGLTIITLTVTTLFAQTTTGTGIVDRMKATVHAFTLGSSLGQTGLESSPIAGKKTGDILTAGEWNRILELVGEGGAGSETVYFTALHTAAISVPANVVGNPYGTLITNYNASQGDINKTTGLFTAPVAGYYVLGGHVHSFTTTDANTYVELLSSTGKNVLGTRSAGSTMPMNEVNTVWYLNAGETVGLYLWNDKPSTNVIGRFTGILINGGNGGGGGSSGGDKFTFLDTPITIISSGVTTGSQAPTTFDISTVAGVTIPAGAKAIQVYVQCNNYTTANQSTGLDIGKSTTSLFSACQSNGMLSANDVDSNSLIVPLAPDGKSIAYKYNMPSSDSGGQIVVSLRGFITE